MGRKKRKRIQKEDTVEYKRRDFISSLPENVAVEIISHLPPRASAAMVQVSRKWKSQMLSHTFLGELHYIVKHPKFLNGNFKHMDSYEIMDFKKAIIARTHELLDIMSNILEVSRARRKLAQIQREMRRIRKPETTEEITFLHELSCFLDSLQIVDLKKRITERSKPGIYFDRPYVYHTEETEVIFIVEGIQLRMEMAKTEKDPGNGVRILHGCEEIFNSTYDDDSDSDDEPEFKCELLRRLFSFDYEYYQQSCCGRLVYYFLQSIVIAVDEADVIPKCNATLTHVEETVQAIYNTIANTGKRRSIIPDRSQEKYQFWGRPLCLCPVETTFYGSMLGPWETDLSWLENNENAL